VSDSDPEKLLANPKVRALFKKELEHYGEKFKGFEGVKDFALIAEDFTTENGLLTPSLKVKRRKVFERYESLLETLYSKKKERAPEEKKQKAEASAE
jgi:long-chain acyl-CoA synthetase